MPDHAVFTLASGRSGTHFLYELIRRNAADCVAQHETYGHNPSMFGRPIYDHAVGDRARTEQLLARKRRIIERCGTATYVETSHAFLKSWFDLALASISRASSSSTSSAIRSKSPKAKPTASGLIKRLACRFATTAAATASAISSGRSRAKSRFSSISTQPS